MPWPSVSKTTHERKIWQVIGEEQFEDNDPVSLRLYCFDAVYGLYCE